MEKNREEIEVIDVETEEKVAEEVNEEHKETESVEEIKEESVEVIEEPLPEEVEVIEFETNVTIEKETYVEYFKSVSFKSQVKPSLVFGLIVVLLSYFFRGENTTATDALLQGLLWGVVFVAISLGVSYFFTPSRAAKTYDRSGINGVVLKTTFSNLGIRQTIEDQSVLYNWSSVTHFIESNISFFGHMPQQRRVLLMSKKNMSEEDINKTREIIKEHLGEDKIQPLK